MKKILLDTNAYTALFAKNKTVFDTVANSETVYMSVFVIGELISGFKGGKQARKNYNALVKFLKKPTVKTLHTTFETAEIFGHIKNILRKNGTPIPANDTWIAAHAIETGSSIVSFDKHFLKINGLLTWQELEN